LVGGCLVALAVVLTFQLVSVTSDLPQYREGIQDKVESVRAMAERPFARLEAELSAVIPQPVPESARSGKKNSRTAAAAAAAAATPEADTRMSVRGALRRLFALAWGPIGQAG
ncbi:hypothetical protein, partial [Glaesserella parasuis]